MNNNRKIRKLLSHLIRKNKLIVARVSDLLEAGFDKDWLAEEFARVDKEVWKDLTDTDHMWTKDQILEHFNVCPEMIYCALLDGKAVCTLTAIRTNKEDTEKNRTWLEKTGNGTLKTHIPTGDLAFGVSLSVMKASQGIGSRMVLSGIMVSLVGEGLKSVYLGARLPGYSKNMHIPVEEYVFSKKENGERLDREINFFERKGFEIVEVVPDYMCDPASCDYGVVMKWDNPFYRLFRIFPFLRKLTKKIGIMFALKLPKSKLG